MARTVDGGQAAIIDSRTRHILSTLMICMVSGYSNLSNRETNNGFHQVPKLVVHKGGEIALHPLLWSGGMESDNVRVSSPLCQICLMWLCLHTVSLQLRDPSFCNAKISLLCWSFYLYDWMTRQILWAVSIWLEPSIWFYPLFNQGSESWLWWAAEHKQSYN